MLGEQIHRVRRETGRSLREMAHRAGTSAATLHAYEHGRKTPGWSTFERIVRVGGYEVLLDLVPSLEPTDYPAAALVRDLASSTEPDRLRLVIEFVDRWNETPDERRPLLFHDDPGSAGDARWDALVGGLVEHLTWHAGLRAPEWIGDLGRFLDERWWPVDLPAVRILAMRSAPIGLSRRGVMLAREDLVRA